MTAKKDFKRLVRALARKSGQSYVAALRYFRQQSPEGSSMTRAAVPSSPATAERPPLRRIEKPEHGFAIHLPPDWVEEAPNPLNSEWEVARFRRPGEGTRFGLCLVYCSPERRGADGAMAAQRAEAALSRQGFGNFRHSETQLAGLPAARLDFDRALADGRTWSVRHHFAVAPNAKDAANSLYCVSFATTGLPDDTKLFDELATRFELVGSAPGVGSRSERVEAAGGSDVAAGAVLSVGGVRRGEGPYGARVRRALVAAHDAARRREAEEVREEHLLIGLAALEGAGEVAGETILEELGVSAERVREVVEELAGPEVVEARESGGAEDENASRPFAAGVERALEIAAERARVAGRVFVGPGDVVAVLLEREEGPTAQLLARLGLTVERVREALSRYAGADGPIARGVRDRGRQPSRS